MRCRSAVRSHVIPQNRSTMSVGSGLALPRLGLLFYSKDGLTDTIGELSIVFTSGDASDLMAATFPFPDSPIVDQAIIDEGVDLYTPRSGAEWYDLLNGSYVWIGPKGIAIYSVDMIAYSSKIQRVLGYYLPALEMLDGLEMLNDLEMTA